MFKLALRYSRYALSTFATVAFKESLDTTTLSIRSFDGLCFGYRSNPQGGTTMDARTFVDTQVVGHQLASKRREAAEKRLARKARREGAASAQTRGRQQIGSTALVMRVVVVLVAVLLVGLLAGQAIARQPNAVGPDDSVRQHLVRGRSEQAQLVGGRGPTSKLLIVRGDGASNTRHLIAYRGVDSDRHNRRAHGQGESRRPAEMGVAYSSALDPLSNGVPSS